MKRTRENKERINVWISKDILVKVRERADRENRTLTNMVETILRDSVEKK